ncbi:MAG: UvrD-helicase domain-containing protein [Bacillota bacterium]|jgi:DNA helicase-2/ATP-dependent DNA helicase PcrA|nr:UvrD-helicase domain-containing protein [Eubacteriales bacterium]MDD3536782.1 UvrD-helicase domain-containing protein [Eubacteriales bacterium]MDD4285395.1 UvrD-helicase domain-containing protein [Eubacteriales bacterium]MDI9492691.1 UvrD-helicase domain-containing protein [Bacillota bacterium]HPF18852.1 UvrD-helicase domain-containing protein [Bacillota bacterium]
MIDYLKKLNPQQYEAATTLEGPLLILAGAGSGKTGTMTHRIAYMIRDAGVDPRAILAVTFTNKAAAEMRDRVEALVGSVQGMWIQTFHSACLRMLRLNPEEAGYARNFVVYDPVDQKSVIKGLLKELDLDPKRFAPAYVLSEISDAKEQAVGAAQYRRENGGRAGYQELAELYDRYEKALKKNNAMDFDDLILRAVQLLEGNRDLLHRYQERFRYLMVDEYQDTNMLQYKLVKLLAEQHGNICVVGDDDQCIYQWRGADIRNILEFEKDFPGAKVIKLEENYRSSAYILDGAHSVISKNRGRKAKKLWTRAEKGEKISYYRASDDKEEARYVGARIEALMRKDSALTFSDFAILYRTNVQSRRFEEALSAKGIPYQVLSGLRYYDRKEIKDVLAYMRLVMNPKDDAGLMRIINEPKRGLGAKSQESLRTLASVRDQNIMDVLRDREITDSFPKKTAESLHAFVSAIDGLHLEQANRSVLDLYDAILVKTGYLAALEEQSTVESESRIENLMEFKSVITEKEREKIAQGETLVLETFLEELTLLADVDNHDPREDTVSLMTLHSAKGLEFSVVFIPGMETGIFPSYRTIDQGEGMEEERRLCYVGMTRAKKMLFLTSAEWRMLYGKTELTSESLFLKEIDRGVMCGDAVYDRKSPASSFARYDRKAPYSEGPYVSPLASLRATRGKADERRTLAGKDVEAGQKVQHDTFGPGTVIEASGNVLTVIFDEYGTKKLAKDLAPMHKVEEQ